MRHDTAGDPITGVKWSRRTTRKIAEELAACSRHGLQAPREPQADRLHQKPRIAIDSSFTWGSNEERFASQGMPIVSVDSKKKEHIGNFKNTGAK
jgi:hypothetical protein